MKYLDYIFDGAMGTYYQQITNQQISSELVNISDSKTIIKIHQEYINAGVNAIKTNTFGLNSNLIEDYAYLKLLINQAIDNALIATKDSEVSVFGDIGPINDTEEYIKIIDLFLNKGINHFIFETLVEYETLQPAIVYLRSKRDCTIIVSFSTDQDGYTLLGNYYQDLIEKASIEANYVGLNCTCGPLAMYKLAQKLDATKYNLSFMPNTSYPNTNNEFVVDNSAYYSDMLLKFVSLNIKIVGGCCGSDPRYIKESILKINNSAITYLKPIKLKKNIVSNTSFIYDILVSQRKLIAAEIEPPKDTDTNHLLEAAFKLKAVGADVLTIVDSPLAQTRADSLMIAAKIKKEVDIDVLPHLTCRDKNQIAIKGGLISANIEGVNNILALSGDAIAKIDRDINKGVFCFNSMNLINYIASLNKDIFYQNPYLIAGALNINAYNFDAELERGLKKINQNVDYFITQSVFDINLLPRLIKAKEVLNKPILIGLYPVATYKNALFLNNEVSGINIPSPYINLLKDANPIDYQKISVEYTNSIIDCLFDYCDGFYLSTPLKKTEYVCDIIKHIKAKEC